MAAASTSGSANPGSARSLALAALPPALVVVILGLDRVQFAHSWPNVIIGILDEPAHLATGVLVLLAFAGPAWLLRHRLFAGAALFFSMAIDADHIPYYAGVRLFTAHGRPFSHSVAMVLLLLVIGALLPIKRFRRLRPVLLGAGVGVALHLIRDLGNGPGVPLLWPLTSRNVIFPYTYYVVAIGLVAVVATVRLFRFSRTPTAPAASGAASIVGARVSG